MIVQEKISEDLVKTYSDSKHKIVQDGTGFVYEEAIDPAAAGRTYTESEEFVDTVGTEYVGQVLYSKYKIMEYLMELRLWEKFKKWIADEQLDDYWTVPLEYEEGNRVFKMLLGAFQREFEFTDEQLDEMKAACRK